MEIKRIVELRSRLEKALVSYIERNKKTLGDTKNIGFINPSSDIYIDGNRQLIFIETPAMIEDSVKIEVVDGNLIFSARKKITRHSGRKYLQIERKVGVFTKTVPLAFKEKKFSSIKHSYKLGVIKIEVEYGEKK